MSPDDFIGKIAPLVQKHAPRYGVKVCSPIIAQAILESGWGESTLGSKFHNYFGMKCGTRWTGASVNMSTKEEYTPGVMTTIQDNFRVYATMEVRNALEKTGNKIGKAIIKRINESALNQNIKKIENYRNKKMNLYQKQSAKYFQIDKQKKQEA